jgi:Bacterial membrane protein YfhO
MKSLVDYIGKHRDGFSIALVVLAIIGFVYPVLFGAKSYYYKDCQIWFYPLRTYLRDHLIRGTLPVWSPELGLGMPFLSAPGNSVFYPLNIILLLPAPACIGQFLIAHLMLAAVGTYAVLRNLGLRCHCAVFGALAYSLSGYLLSMMSHSGLYVMSIAWMPMIVWLGRRLILRRKAMDFALFGIALGLQILTGEFQGCLFTAALLAVFVVAKKDRRLSSFLILGAGAVYALVIAMPQLISTLNLLPTTSRAQGLEYSKVVEFSLHPLRIFELFVAGLYGDSIELSNYLAGFMVGKPYSVSPWFATAYCGSLCAIFAIVGLAQKSEKHRRWVTGVVILGLVSLFLAMGKHTPVFKAYYSVVPIASFFRYPAKFFALVTLCLSLVSAFGLESWLARRGTKRSNYLLATIWGSVAMFVLLAAWAAPSIAGALHARTPSIDINKAIALVKNACLLEGSLLVVLGASFFLAARRRPGWLDWMAPAMLYLQLAMMNHVIPVSIDTELYVEQPVLAGAVVAGTPEGEPPRLYVQSRQQMVFEKCLSSGSTVETASWRQAVLDLNIGINHGVSYNNAYVATRPPEVFKFWRQTHDIRAEILDLMSVKYAVFPRDYPGLDESAIERILTREFPCLTIYSSRRVLPVARPVRDVIKVAGIDEVLAKIRRPEVLKGTAALIDSLPKTDLPTGGKGLGKCVSKRQKAQVFETACDLPEESWVVVNIGYNPRLEATVDGEPSSLFRANGIVTSLRVPAGRHVVQIEYHEPLLGPGLMISFLAMLAGIVVIFVGFYRRKKER